MFRKTFIRLIVVTMIATTTLIVFAAFKSAKMENSKECSETGQDCGESSQKSEFLLLESFGRALMHASRY